MLEAATPLNKYTLKGVSCTESAIDGVVARVFLERFQFNESSKNTDKESEKPIKKRGRKKIIQDTAELKEEETLQEDRGIDTKPAKRRGRPKKIQNNLEATSTSNGQLVLEGSLNKHKESNVKVYFSKREKKPNPKFSDYIISSGISPSLSPHKHKSKSMNDTIESDPLAIPSSDEVVHSFLPVAETTDSELNTAVVIKSETDISNKNNDKEKENHTNNQVQLKEEKSEQDFAESPSFDLNVKQYRKRGRPRVYVNKKNSFMLAKKQKLDDEKDLLPADEVPVNTSGNSTYMLVDNDSLSNKTKSGPGKGMDFNNLVKSLKLIKLPAPNWKIRIVVSRQQSITEVTFTNKETKERCVRFSKQTPGFTITFDKAVVKLLGSPAKISCCDDVTTLLDIIEHIDSDDPILEYNP